MIEGLDIQRFSAMTAEVVFAWADKHYTFRLPVAQLLELQELTDQGPYELLNRMRDSRWRVQDIRETIRLGLIGGGLAPDQAAIMVRRYVDQRPLAENIPACLMILTAAVVGVPTDAPPKSKGARQARGRRSQTASSARPKS